MQSSAFVAVRSLNNKAESRLVTIGSNLSHLDGEANLTFDGSTLTVTGTANATTLAIGGTSIGATAAEINDACDASARTAAAVTVADDHFLFCDGGATGATRVESIADLMTAVAGTGLSASSGALNVDASQTGITAVGTIATGTWQGTAIAQGYIADDAISLAKMAGLARGKIIVGDSSGNPAALALGSDTQVLTSDGSDIVWADAGGGGGGAAPNDADMILHMQVFA
jgi:hypothetical protein